MPTLQVVGVELSADMIRVAESNRALERADNVSFIQGDAAQLERLETASIDGVISNGSLHHWVAPVAVFDEVARVLKPGGVFAICDNRRDISFGGRLLVSALTSVMWLTPDAPRAMRLGWRSSIAAAYTPNEVRRLLAQSKLRDVEVKEDLLDLLIHSPRPAQASDERNSYGEIVDEAWATWPLPSCIGTEHLYAFRTVLALIRRIPRRDAVVLSVAARGHHTDPARAGNASRDPRPR